MSYWPVGVHLALLVFHATVSLIVAMIGNLAPEPLREPITLTTRCWNLDQLDVCIQPLFYFTPAQYIWIFTYLSSLAHTVQAGIAIYRVTWVRTPSLPPVNYVRWIEYSLSASWMVLLIALRVGITDLWMLIYLFFMGVCMNLCGLWSELWNAKLLTSTDTTDSTPYQRLLPYAVGCIPYCLIFLHLFQSFSTNLPLARTVVSARILAIIYASFTLLWLFFTSFAIVMLYTYLPTRTQKAQEKAHRLSDHMYNGLSFTSKTILTFLILSASVN
jgi:hypothetical protein